MNPITVFLAPYKAYLFAGAAVAVAAGVLYVVHLRHEVQVLQVAKVVAADKATVSTAQAAAITDGTAIATKGSQRDALSITLHEANDHAIETAAGASASVDPALNLAGRRGLCRYAAYATDPGCAGLLQGDPAYLPPAGGADPASRR